jgi:outer membrane protein OmpA-like peptidoglycan-associated protein/tetratricopeptide (TPR) repeat protein
MKPCLVTAVLVFLFSSVFSQDAKTLVAKGDKLLGKGDYSNALSLYMQVLESQPEDAHLNFKIGLCHLHGEKKTKAISYLEKAYDLDPKIDLDIEYHMGLAYQYDHQYSRAKKFFESFKQKNKKLSDIADHKIAECTIGDSLIHHPTYVEIKNIGNIVNTGFHEYAPLLSADGSTLIFTSNRSTDEYQIKSGTNFEDIYITHKIENGWDEPQKISPEINSSFHDAAASISHDGKTLFLYYEDGAGDIYTSKLENGEWSEPVPLNKNINLPTFWETSACISADGKKLYFTSNRPGGEGELDIYVSELDSKGDWGKAVNLGPTINTPMHEDSPYIHADGVTLYFSSDGHPTMGSNDIFKSELKDGKWSKPQNMGYPINSIEYDGFFMMSEDKKTGYFSALREDGMGNSDLYQVAFFDPPPKIEPEEVFASADTSSMDTLIAAADTVETADTTVVIADEFETYIDPLIELQKGLQIVTILKGKVIDEVTSQPLHALITLVNNETNEIIERIYSKTGTGDFELVIPHGGNFGVSTEAGGYLFNSINFNLPQFAEFQEIDTHILMVKAEVGSKAVLKNIFFDTGKAELKPESVGELEKLRQLLVSNGNMKMQINGHTDNTGNPATNKVLSLKRAEAVVQYLIEKGVDASRLSAKGFGAERPLVSNDDEQEGREINRRTEIEIIESTQG